MFLMDRRNKMFRKIAIIIPMFLFCLGLDNCVSPEGPEEPEPIYEYRYNDEVIYKHTTVYYPKRQYWVRQHCYLYDPALMVPPNPRYHDFSFFDMEKIGENKYRCYLSQVFIQTNLHSEKHYVLIGVDIRRDPRTPTAENINIQGAYDQEVKIYDFDTFVNSRLYFKMSKE